MSNHKASDVEVLILKQKGNKAFEKDAFEQAESLFSEAIALDSTMSVLYSNRALARLRLSNWEGCLQDCDTCLSFDPNSGRAYVRKARALLELGRFDEAREALASAERIDPLQKEISSVRYRLEKRSNHDGLKPSPSPAPPSPSQPPSQPPVLSSVPSELTMSSGSIAPERQEGEEESTWTARLKRWEEKRAERKRLKEEQRKREAAQFERVEAVPVPAKEAGKPNHFFLQGVGHRERRALFQAYLPKSEATLTNTTAATDNLWQEIGGRGGAVESAERAAREADLGYRVCEMVVRKVDQLTDAHWLLEDPEDEDEYFFAASVENDVSSRSRSNSVATTSSGGDVETEETIRAREAWKRRRLQPSVFHVKRLYLWVGHTWTIHEARLDAHGLLHVRSMGRFDVCKYPFVFSGKTRLGNHFVLCVNAEALDNVDNTKVLAVGFNSKDDAAALLEAIQFVKERRRELISVSRSNQKK